MKKRLFLFVCLFLNLNGMNVLFYPGIPDLDLIEKSIEKSDIKDFKKQFGQKYNLTKNSEIFKSLANLNTTEQQSIANKLLPNLVNDYKLLEKILYKDLNQYKSFANQTFNKVKLETTDDLFYEQCITGIYGTSCICLGVCFCGNPLLGTIMGIVGLSCIMNIKKEADEVSRASIIHTMLCNIENNKSVLGAIKKKYAKKL